MTSENDTESEPELASLLERIERLPPEQRSKLRAKLDERPTPPLAGWTPDPLKFKAALRYLADRGSATRAELAEYLGSLSQISDISSMEYGLVGRKTNDVFVVEKGDRKADDVLSLTEQGEHLADMFDDDLEGLRPVEKTLYRGLSLYGHMVAFLGILERHRRDDGHEDGMLKEDLIEEMAAYYADEATTYTGYLGTLCDRLDLITRTRDGNRARYDLTVPERW